MAFRKSTESRSRATHEWETNWSPSDYKNHEKELLEIDRDWKEAIKLSRDSEVFPEYHYQQMHGGMSKNFNVFHSDMKEETGEYQSWDINKFKLDKYHKWRMMNMSAEDRNRMNRRSAMIWAEINKLMKEKTDENA